MKKWLDEPKNLFTLLAGASVIAIAAGTYLGVALGMAVQASVTALSLAGILLWAWAWGEFLGMCLRLRKGESAFTPATGRTLRIIGWCMVGLAAISAACALIGGLLSRLRTGYWVIEIILLPGTFLTVALIAHILRGLLVHAMALEEEQEGVV